MIKLKDILGEDLDQNNNGYPDGTERTKTAGDKILVKLAKLLKSPSSKIEISNDQVRASNLNFGFGPTSTFVVSNREDYYLMNTNKGWFRVDKSDILKAEDLYDELESIIQTGTTKRPSSRETDMFGTKNLHEDSDQNNDGYPDEPYAPPGKYDDGNSEKTNYETLKQILTNNQGNLDAQVKEVWKWIDDNFEFLDF